MAQHWPITEKYEGETKDETRAIRKLVRDVRKDIRDCRETGDVASFESKYKRLPDDYLEKGETEAYAKGVDVPASLIWGGRAIVEVHFRMSRISKIYLVA